MEVDYRGNVDDTMLDVLGGLRSACTYVGAGKIKEMPKRTTFIRCVLDISTVSQGISGGLVARFCCAVAR